MLDMCAAPGSDAAQLIGILYDAPSPAHYSYYASRAQDGLLHLQLPHPGEQVVARLLQDMENRLELCDMV